MKTVVYWKTTKEKRLEICKGLGLEFRMNVNGESTYNLDEDQRKKLRELENEGLIVIREKP